MQAATGQDRFAGWALVVAYRDTAQPARSLAVFDGLVSVSQGVNTSSVGDRPSHSRRRRRADDGRRRRLRGRPRSHRASRFFSTRARSSTPSTRPSNFFNSTISSRGANFTAKSPDFDNQLGFDADLVTADGILPNDATSAVIRASSAGVPGSDGFYPQAFTFATDLYAPAVELAKTVENVTTPGGPAEPGDTLRYTVTV